VDLRGRLLRWAAAHPIGAEVGGGVATALAVLGVSLWQWGLTSDGIFRGLTLGTWMGVLVAYLLRRRRRREERAAAAALEERLRIARELHDTVAGAVGAIGIQAAAARRVLRTRPDEAAVALERIELASRAANEDLRRMLLALRGGAPVPVERELGLAGLGALIADARTGGLAVTTQVDPAALALADRDADHAAFRIVQEALANAARHAGSAAVEVRVRVVTGDRLQIDVVNGAPQGPHGSPGAGFGLVGMRERAERLGGRLDAGPTSGGGFAVHAALPLRSRAKLEAHTGRNGTA